MKKFFLINNIYQKLNFNLGFILLCITIVFIIFGASYFNPDFYAYEKIYNNADYWFKSHGFNYFLFYYLASILNNFLYYDSLRIFLAIFQVIIYIYFFKRLNFKLKNLNLLICLPLISFLILKVHIQLRESLALIGFFYIIFDLSENKKLSIKNIGILIISLLMHSSIIVFLIPSIIYIFGDFLGRNKKRLIYIFFFLLSLFASISILRFSINGQLTFLSDIGLSLEQYNEQYSISFSYSKFLYRASYFILFFLIYFEEFLNNSLVLKNKFVNQNAYILGFISLNGLIIVLPTVAIIGLFTRINSVSYNLIFRLVSSLFIYLSFYRTLVYPRKFLTLALNLFIAIDIFRMFFI